MIEIIYKEESKKEETESVFQIPNNIRQIGESKGSQKIYVEDYAYTFLRKISRGTKEGKIAILLGEHHFSQGTTYLFIKSALQIKEMEVSPEHVDFNEKVWGEVYENGNKYFPNQEILGWFVSIPGFSMQLNEMLIKTHLDYFAGSEKVLFVVEPGEWDEAFYIFENGQMNRQSGYYIYYEKNEKMQNYMIEMSENKSIEETENIPDRAVVNFRKTVQNTQNEEQKPEKRMWTMGAYVALAVLAIGVAVYSRSESLQRMVLTSFERQEQYEDTQVSALPQENKPTNLPNTTPTPVPTVRPTLGASENDTQKDNTSFLGEENQTNPQGTGQSTENNPSDTLNENTENSSGEQETDVSSLREYIIQKGDTLTSISMKQYGTLEMIEEICRINQISKEDVIFAGRKLILPEKSVE